jgi:hypothetical protein
MRREGQFQSANSGALVDISYLHDPAVPRHLHIAMSQISGRFAWVLNKMHEIQPFCLFLSNILEIHRALV